MIALPCARNGLLFGRDAKGARALVSAKLLDADPAAMPAIVDHELVGLEGPVRNQRSPPACTAFALASAIDRAVARRSGKTSNVSAMEIWSRYHEPFAKTVGADAAWPFDERIAKGWLPCEPGAKPPREGCGLTPDAKRAAKLAAEPVATFTDVTYLDDDDLDAIVTCRSAST